MTIFGASWADLGVEHVEAYLGQADDEPLLWEAKGTDLKAKEVRRQVCAFANGHEPGYLILGAEKAEGDDPEHKWELDGVEFPDEPTLWISNVVADRENGVRPRPDFDVKPWPAKNGHVAVVRITPTSTPPCIANGTVYERLPGKTQTVQDPLKLADLFARGDRARQGAQASADRAALVVVKDWLAGDAGQFRTQWVNFTPADDEEPKEDEDEKQVRFAVGVAATGHPPNISGRLFQPDFVDEVREQLGQRPGQWPQQFASPSGHPTWSQEAITWRHEIRGPVDAVTIVRAAWDGSAAVGEKLLTEDVHVGEFVHGRVEPAWTLADQIVSRLEGFGDVYVTVLITGGRFPKSTDSDYLVMRRGPVLPGIDEDHVASLDRELKRATGRAEPEPPPPEPPEPESEPASEPA